MGEVARREAISIVVPCYNEAEVFPYLQKALTGLADCIGQDYDVEIILIDDGSWDATWEKIRRFAALDSRVRGVSLSRNFGHQAALTCGYDVATGDAVVCMDADLQDPPEVIPQMVQLWRDGNDVVYGFRTDRQGESAFKLWTAKVFYRLINRLSETKMPFDAGDFRLLDRRVVEPLVRPLKRRPFRIVDLELAVLAALAGVPEVPIG